MWWWAFSALAIRDRATLIREPPGVVVADKLPETIAVSFEHLVGHAALEILLTAVMGPAVETVDRKPEPAFFAREGAVPDIAMEDQYRACRSLNGNGMAHVFTWLWVARSL